MAAIAVLAVCAAGFGYAYFSSLADSASARERATALETQLASSTAHIASLETQLTEAWEEGDDLARELAREQGKNEEFESQIRTISRTVGDLDKLARTDEELLQKYSKVSFLNEHYIPERLSLLDKEYAYDESREFYVHAAVEPFFEQMVEDAKDDGVDFWVASAYRSFETQSVLKGTYTVTYGTGANAFSADQGFSEHQLGTTLDLTTTGLGGGLTGFDTTPAYEWLREHAHEYGFVLSYPPNNAYYIFEPWHWRFVGRDLAEHLHDEEEFFYDLDQREIDEYLLTIFD